MEGLHRSLSSVYRVLVRCPSNACTMLFERLYDVLRTLVRFPSSTCAKPCLWSLGYVSDERKGNIKVNYEDLSFLEQDQGQAEPPKIGRISID